MDDPREDDEWGLAREELASQLLAAAEPAEVLAFLSTSEPDALRRAFLTWCARHADANGSTIMDSFRVFRVLSIREKVQIAHAMREEVGIGHLWS